MLNKEEGVMKKLKWVTLALAMATTQARADALSEAEAKFVTCLRDVTARDHYTSKSNHAELVGKCRDSAHEWSLLCQLGQDKRGYSYDEGANTCAWGMLSLSYRATPHED